MISRRVTITPADSGRRVTVRTRIADPGQGGPHLTDTVGILERWDEGTLEIRRRDGSLARIDEDDITAARVVRAPGAGPAPR